MKRGLGVDDDAETNIVVSQNASCLYMRLRHDREGQVEVYKPFVLTVHRTHGREDSQPSPDRPLTFQGSQVSSRRERHSHQLASQGERKGNKKKKTSTRRTSPGRYDSEPS